MLAALAAAGSAYAHGDPASHYLETDLLYPSFVNPPSQELELELLGLLQAAERDGYPIKVALVSRDDLIDGPGMLRTPRRYAEMVTSTLEFAGDLTAPVVIVTPHGIGVGGREGTRFVGFRRGSALTRGVDLPPDADADAMARAAMSTVRRIARAGGHPLPADVPPAQVVVSRSPSRGEGAPSASDDGGSAPWIPLAAAAGAIAIGAAVLRRRKVSVR